MNHLYETRFPPTADYVSMSRTGSINNIKVAYFFLEEIFE